MAQMPSGVAPWAVADSTGQWAQYSPWAFSGYQNAGTWTEASYWQQPVYGQWHAFEPWNAASSYESTNRTCFYNTNAVAASAADLAMQRALCLPPNASDAEKERALEDAVVSLALENRFDEAQSMFLAMRCLWHSAQKRFRERGLSFGGFNAPYQRAFRELRNVAERIAPAHNGSLPAREFVSCTGQEGLATKPHLRIMTFNVLSEYLNDLFSYQFVVLPKGMGDFLRWQFRQHLLIEEIARWTPSIVALQEVDLKLHAAFVHMLHERCGLHSTPIIRRNERASDGLCFLYNPNIVAPVNGTLDSRLLVHGPPDSGYSGGNAVACAVFEIVLEGHAAKGRRAGMVTTHVAGKEPACTPEVLSELLAIANSLDCDMHFLLGDLNGCVPSALDIAKDSGYSNAYALVGNVAMASGGPIVTAHNDEYHWSGELDFIWFSESGGRCRHVAQIQCEERLVAERSSHHPTESLPNPHWPSDHVSLVAEFDFV